MRKLEVAINLYIGESRLSSNKINTAGSIDKPVIEWLNNNKSLLDCCDTVEVKVNNFIKDDNTIDATLILDDEQPATGKPFRLHDNCSIITKWVNSNFYIDKAATYVASDGEYITRADLLAKSK